MRPDGAHFIGCCHAEGVGETRAYTSRALKNAAATQLVAISGTSISGSRTRSRFSIDFLNLPSAEF